jgi:hypothetical protein
MSWSHGNTKLEAELVPKLYNLILAQLLESIVADGLHDVDSVAV